MKFVCRKCDEFMRFDEAEAVSEGSLGVSFACDRCGARISMVTNPGETQIVKSLGVQLGGRSEAPEPLELTRKTLASASPQTADAAPSAAPGTVPWDPEAPEGRGELRGPGGVGDAAAMPSVQAAEALKKSLGKCPFANVVAGMAQAPAENPQKPAPALAAVASAQVTWTPDAQARLERVPDFVRPFAKTMIEDMARQNGSCLVDGVLMDAAKEKFM